jgi:hypothetical protein
MGMPPPGGMSGSPFGGSGMPAGGMGGFFPGGFGGPSAVEQSDPNLIDVAVYGIASLYERYPPKPPKTEGGAPPAGGAAGGPDKPQPPGK